MSGRARQGERERQIYTALSSRCLHFWKCGKTQKHSYGARWCMSLSQSGELSNCISHGVLWPIIPKTSCTMRCDKLFSCEGNWLFHCKSHCTEKVTSQAAAFVRVLSFQQICRVVEPWSLKLCLLSRASRLQKTVCLFLTRTIIDPLWGKSCFGCFLTRSWHF